jgi:flagellar basal body-associated protein FliL
MADAEESEGTKKDAKKGKSKNNNMIPAVVVALGLVVAGKMMGGAKTAASAAPAMAPHEAGTPMDCAVEDIRTPPKEGAVFKLDSIPINLADGHYAKVGMALQLSAVVDAKLFKEESEAYKASDVLISVIGGRDRAEFNSPQALEALKEKITAEVRPKFECKVLEVLFTEFVIQ